MPRIVNRTPSRTTTIVLPEWIEEALHEAQVRRGNLVLQAHRDARMPARPTLTAALLSRAVYAMVQEGVLSAADPQVEAILRLNGLVGVAVTTPTQPAGDPKPEGAPPRKSRKRF